MSHLCWLSLLIWVRDFALKTALHFLLDGRKQSGMTWAEGWLLPHRHCTCTCTYTCIYTTLIPGITEITHHEMTRFPALEFWLHQWRVVSKLAVGPVMSVDTALIGIINTVFTCELGSRTHFRLWQIRLWSWLVWYFLCWILNYVLHPNDLFSIRGTGRAVAEPGTSGMHQMPKHGDPIVHQLWGTWPVSLLNYGRLESTLPSLDLRKTEQIHLRVTKM